MKRLLPILIAVALIVPATDAFAAGKAKKASKKVVDSERCAGDRDVKSVVLGKEIVFVSQDLRMVSFTKTEACTLKHTLVYFNPKSGEFKKTPGMDPTGESLIPGFKHGEVWYPLAKDENGNPTVGNAPAADATYAPVEGAGDMINAAPAKPAKKAKKDKKGKKGKKAKKAKKEAAPKADEQKATEPAPAAPAADPAPAGK